MSIQGIIDGCKKNDRKAQFRLYELYVDYVINTCQRYSKDDSSTKEFTQKTFIKVFEKIHQFDNRKGSFKNWIQRIAVNECLQHLRQKDRLVFVEELYEMEPYEEQECDQSNLDHKRIISLVHELPEGYRTVFLLYVVEEYSHQEIAEQLGISEASSRSQLFKARKALKKKFNHFPVMTKLC